ncbi:hypothetical protein LTR86_008732 [Recurvomyces mirabilis]|nr:hypothetical protein LTR86_008732 [Recurvomyces mirabilis]
MAHSLLAVTSFIAFWLSPCAAAPANVCKCAPIDPCWPSSATWSRLNATVHGQLIKTTPIAVSCYTGSEFNPATCASVDAQWTDARFQALSPIGLDYPINTTCPPVNLTTTQTPAGTDCTLGTNPWYAVNATSASDVSAAVDFARENTIRLVIKTTGHDILGRSDGYGSLEIWLKYLRNGIQYIPSYSVPGGNWTGAAISIIGGYTWDDVYPIAQQHNVVVVGGGTPSVSTSGGWMQGGGHGPASRTYGLGADQVLSAEVVLADGSIITASPSQNQDVFFAIRGGGPGTYGVVTKTVIKAHPMTNVTVQHLAIAPLTTNISALLDAVTILFHDFPDLNDAGYAGYGTWAISEPTPLFANFTAGYVHGIYMMNSTLITAEAAFTQTLEKLQQYNTTSLFISLSYLTYPDYWSFYHAESGVESPAGSPGVLTSSLFSRHSVQSSPSSLRRMIETIAGTPNQYTTNALELVSGGAVFDPAAYGRYSGVNSAWRRSYFNNIVARGLPPNANTTAQKAIWDDIQAKGRAMKELAPETGVYMNEADRLDPEFEADFYGQHYKRLLGIKHARDPKAVFYCPTCVGSGEWEDGSGEGEGRLCRVTS